MPVSFGPKSMKRVLYITHTFIIIEMSCASKVCPLTSAPPSVMRLLERSKEVKNLFFCKASDICSMATSV